MKNNIILPLILLCFLLSLFLPDTHVITSFIYLPFSSSLSIHLFIIHSMHSFFISGFRYECQLRCGVFLKGAMASGF